MNRMAVRRSVSETVGESRQKREKVASVGDLGLGSLGSIGPVLVQNQQLAGGGDGGFKTGNPRGSNPGPT